MVASHRGFKRLRTREARLRAFFAYDVEFHQAVILGSGSRSLGELLSVVRDRLLLCRHRTMTLPGRLERSIAEHAAILVALRQRNGALAEARVRRHIRRLRQEFADSIRADERRAVRPRPGPAKGGNA
jgi:DNA-binding GntR family transcriptional regulator